ncbi:hypothetical protein G6F59_014404 [Rhizopus arrhizus]|nr:hypothetical protein G6F59_014404 [Rhizopus arrhizus]
MARAGLRRQYVHPLRPLLGARAERGQRADQRHGLRQEHQLRRAILRIAGSSWFVDYSHNGLNTVGDVFEFSDTDGNTVTVTMIIDPPASSIVVSPAVLDPMTAGTSFSQTLSATGGASPDTYAINGGQLPQGLALNSNGTLSGTPTRRGAVSFTVRATDNLGAVVDKAYALTVQNPSLSITPTAATAVIGNAFSLALNGSGGVAPYTYAVESGALPPGITFNGVDTFSVQARRPTTN